MVPMGGNDTRQFDLLQCPKHTRKLIRENFVFLLEFAQALTYLKLLKLK